MSTLTNRLLVVFLRGFQFWLYVHFPPSPPRRAERQWCADDPEKGGDFGVETIEEERRGVVSIVKGHFVVVKDSVFSFYEKDTNFHFWVIFDGDRELTEWRYLMKYLQKECTNFEKGDIFWKRYERKRNNNNNLKNFAVFVVKRSLNNTNVEHGMWSTRVGIEVGMGNFTFLLTWETGWEMWRCWFNDHI